MKFVSEIIMIFNKKEKSLLGIDSIIEDTRILDILIQFSSTRT